jgi:hypothetical protein
MAPTRIDLMELLRKSPPPEQVHRNPSSVNPIPANVVIGCWTNALITMTSTPTKNTSGTHGYPGGSPSRAMA